MMPARGGGSPLLGSRSLREEYLRPAHREMIPRHLQLIEEQIQKQGLPAPVATVRSDLPRFQHLFSSGELFPTPVFIAALEVGRSERLNGSDLPYDAQVLVLRDKLLAAYKLLVAKIRRLLAREIDMLPPQMLQTFAEAWHVWESAWLENREVHACEAMQPLCKAILSLEPLLLSHEKERLLPWPRVQHQKAVTLKCLEGFVHSLSEFSAHVLPSLSREMNHDTRLLVLMEHVLAHKPASTSMESCLAGLSSTPNVTFPDDGSSAHSQGHAINQSTVSSNTGTSLHAYAFRLMGSMGESAPTAGASGPPAQKKTSGTSGGPPPSMLSRKAPNHAGELLTAFENIKDYLLSLKSTLESMDAALDQNEELLGHLVRFERAFKRSKRLFLEPDNLV
eukprot:gnl/MRDRNA2_/MRDRNA2_120218_c0_seq1.p1 gnl/MRDRNA2_/MRDRNA2_120218_c0~~gnl/MRDRNA2_/MRDRNA2_120218_c0_seq1.p1  ORF type:complete len:432 (+),score=61.32 gnl/MRDRNA2_/MRDRNA2_120218_c0_seq1:120-1298(+)